jgi:proline-specific peptidase
VTSIECLSRYNEKQKKQLGFSYRIIILKKLKKLIKRLIMSSKKVFQLILELILLLLIFVLGIAAAVIGFIAAAYFLIIPFWICLTALLLCLGVTTGLAWVAGKRIAPKIRARFALGCGVVTAAAVVSLAYFTLFKPLVPAKERYVRAPVPGIMFWDLPGGSRIAYLKVQAANKTHAEPIIFVHGGPGAGILSAKFVTDAISVFAREGYDIYFYDQIGGGYSGRLENPSEYTLHRQIKDLESIRCRIGAEKVILIGESFGGTLSAHYIAEFPAHVTKCIFISPGALNNFLKEQIKDHLPRLLMAELLMDINPQTATGFISDGEADSFIRKTFTPLLRAFACDPNKLPLTKSIDFGFWANTMMEKDLQIRHDDVQTRLKFVNLPVLILKGECDYVKWDATYQYKTAFANSKFMYIEKAGHMIYADKPDIFHAVISAFLHDKPLPLPEYSYSFAPKM